jgi:hypothetical protein
VFVVVDIVVVGEDAMKATVETERRGNRGAKGACCNPCLDFIETFFPK